MKKLKYIFFSIAILASTLVFSQNNPLIGTWITVDGADTVSLELTKAGVYFITYSDVNDEVIGGINTYSDEFGDLGDSIFLDHKYAVDMSVFPHRLTLTAYYTGTDSFCLIIPAIFELKENNSIWLVIHDDGIYSEDGDEPEPMLKKFYSETKIDDKQFEVLTFTKLK